MSQIRRKDYKSKIIFSLGIVCGIFLVCFLANLVGFFAPQKALAVSIDYGLGATLGLGTADLLETVINIIQWVLGLLGLVAVIIILYGGFIWMTAAGNAEKIKKAKRILINALVGLVIVLLSWAIIYFVMGVINNATNGSGGGACGATFPTGCPAGQECCAPDDCRPRGTCPGGSFPSDFEITEVEVSRDGLGNVYQCSKVKTKFNANVDSTSVEDAESAKDLETFDTDNSLHFNGDFTTLGRTITFDHPDLFTINTNFQEEYPKSGNPIKDTSAIPRTVERCQAGVGCDNSGDPLLWDFLVGDQNDTEAPYIVSAYPVISTQSGYPDRNVSRAPVITATFDEPIDDATIMAGTPTRPIAGNFILEELDGQGGTVQDTIDNSLLLADPATNGFNVYIEDPFLNPLKAFTWYRITVQNVEDLCSNPMDAAEVWEFQTNDSVPGIQSWYPTGANECPDVAVYVTFGTTMYYNAVTIQISNIGDGGADTRTATLNPEALWPGPYQVTTGGGDVFEVTDPADPPDNGFRVFRFTPSASWATNSTYTVDITTDMVIDQSGTFLTHQWQFTTSDPQNCTCSPYISRLDPDQGPRESCLTIQGTCFKGTVSNPADPTNINFNDGVNSVDVAPIPGTWGDDYITTTLPPVYDNGNRPGIIVTIDYFDPSYGTLSSQDPGPSFFVNSGSTATGPCLWSVSPNQGYEGDGTHLNGIRFGNVQGTGKVTFGGGTDATNYPSWNDTDINSAVPVGAITGDVTVTDDAGQTSNGVPFTVHHHDPDAPYVVTDTSCVGQPSSPSPWDDERNACLNSIMSARFNESMNTATTTDPNNIYVEECTDSTCNSFVGGHVAGNLQALTVNNPNDAFTFTPAASLAVDTWYQGTITTGVQNTSGAGMASPYYWQFKTKVDPGPCQINSYSLLATDDILYNQFDISSYTAIPTGPNCQSLDPADYTWNWSSSDPGIAFIQNPNLNTAEAVALDQGITTIESSAQGESAPPGQRNLQVDLDLCEENADCSSCPGSQCVNNHCTPVIQSFSPSSGAIGNFVTVNGCMFGSNQGLANMEFTGQGGPGTWVDAIWPDQCNPDLLWGNFQIIAEVPNIDTPTNADDAATGPIRVTNEYGDQYASGNNYTVNNVETPNLCGLVPSSGPAGTTNFDATGERFSDGVGDNITFKNSAGRSNANVHSWDDTLINADVPGDALSSTGSDGVKVVVDGIESNPADFYITCSSNGECSSGCCYGYQCVDPAFCSTGGPGSLCQISDNPATPEIPENPNCATGPLGVPSGYDCISNTGDTSSLVPPPPENPPLVLFGDDCRVCCEPGQTYNSLVCTADQGDCSGADRGLYCGCTVDPDCGNQATIGCADTTGTRCCYERPSIESRNPDAGATDVCLNAAITVTFDTLMDPASFADNFEVEDMAGAPVDGSISSYNQGGKTTLVFTPTNYLNDNELYRVTITGDNDLSDGDADGVISINQVGMNGGDTYTFAAGNELCQIDRVEVSVVPPVGGQVTNFDLYTCSNDTGCSDDQNVGMTGNQHLYTAQAYDANNTPLTAAYNWSDPEANGIIDVVDPGNKQTEVTALGPDGQENVMVTADAGDQGQASTIVVARVDACQNPWPTAPPYYYIDNDSNFLTYYCKDGGLPDVTITEGSWINPADPDVDELLKEFFFTPNDGLGDVVGMRVMENSGFLSARSWFNNMFPEDTGAGGSGKIVDGYEGLQVGRTVYVAATNLDDILTNKLYPNIYLISYNDNAQSSTVNIYNQMLENWYFNTNVTGNCNAEPNKQCIIRDTKRVTDLGEIGFELLEYQSDNGGLPHLTAGTFLEGITTSKWPSWISQLGNSLGATLPNDPLNIFDPESDCPVPLYDPAGTCWNDTDKIYTCPADSHIYQYKYSGGTAYLYASLEYSGIGNWITNVGDPCSSYSGSNCACFNYEIDSGDDFGVHAYYRK